MVYAACAEALARFHPVKEIIRRTQSNPSLVLLRVSSC